MKKYKNFNITFVKSPVDAETGGRILYAKDYVDDTFFLTYADGVGNIKLEKLLKAHNILGETATITVVNPRFQYGIMIPEEFYYPRFGVVSSFKEKPIMKDILINAGFMVFEVNIFKYIKKDSDVLERDVFSRLIRKKELAYYHHKGFWQSMDTYKDCIKLNDMWKEKPRWKIW